MDDDDDDTGGADDSRWWRHRARVWVLAGAVLALAVVATALALLHARVETWMREQLEEVAATHLRVALNIDALDYSFPFTATLGGVAFVAPDGTRVLEAESITLRLGQLPSAEDPLIIEGIRAHGVVLRLHQRPEGGVVGLSDLFRTPPEDPDVTASDVFQLRHVEVSDGEIQYRPSASDDAMVLDDLDAALEISRAEEREATPWYRVTLDSSRADQISVAGSAAVSLDEKLVDVSVLALEINVDADTLRSLPPPLRDLADEHEARGRYRGIAWGRWNVGEPTESELFTSMSLEDANLAIGNVRVHSKWLQLIVSMSGGAARLHSLRAAILDGTVRAHGDVSLHESPKRLRADWGVNGLDLNDVLRASGERRTSDLGGQLSGHGKVELRLGDGEPDISGSGRVRVRDGRLIVLPGFERLAQRLERSTEGNHDGSARFEFGNHAVHFSELEIETPMFGVTAQGRIGYDGQLDLSVAAGPLQKAGGGPVRDAIARVGASLWNYRLAGTIADPRVTAHPLSIGSSRPGR